MKTTTTIKWFARCYGIERMGPFETQVEAAKALRINSTRGIVYPTESFVWPEEVDPESDDGLSEDRASK